MLTGLVPQHKAACASAVIALAILIVSVSAPSVLVICVVHR
jgi:hypothetical protein